MEESGTLEFERKPPHAIAQPGPVLKRAMRGNYRKGKKPKDVPSAAQVADALAAHWGLKPRV